MEQGAARTSLMTPAMWIRRMAFSVAVGAFLGVVGAFGSYGAVPLPQRLAAWIAMVCFGALIYPPFTVLAIVQGRRWGVSTWFSLPFAVALASVPVTLFAGWATAHLMGAPTEGWLTRYGEVLIVALPAVAGYVGFYGLLNRSAAAATTTPAAASPREAAFMARLPARLGRDLLCLQMEDHYVRVHTATGSDLILMRLRDAVAELEGVPGLQVHRSWWVAASAVAGHLADGRRVALRLRNGLEVPVARAAVPTVRKAGWLD